MLSKIAWRNIWRNRLRSLVVIFSIVIGIWAGVFVMALTVGLNDQRTKGAINTSLSHIQIHSPAFLTEYSLKNNIPDASKIAVELGKTSLVKSYSLRISTNGMISSAATASGVRITGIDPENEKKVTTINTKTIDGSFFEGKKRNPVFLGKKLADKLNLHVGSKTVITFQNDSGDLVSGAFKVTGIYKTSNTTYDEANVYVRNEDMQRLLADGKKYQEIAMLLNNFDSIPSFRDHLKKEFPSLSVQSWDEQAPELGYANEVISNEMYIFIGIILLALAFGIINTMMMAVLERRHELGMLMAVGMNKKRVFFMIMLETVFLSLAGGPLGLLLSYLSILYFGHQGINLAVVAKGLESIGIDAIIYTSLDTGIYFNVGLMIIITAILASIYPARKALKLKPVEAVRVI